MSDAIRESVEGEIAPGLAFFSMSATVPAGFKMLGHSVPGLTIEIHKEGRSRTEGLSHNRALDLRTGYATAIFTDQPESWETRAAADNDVELFTLLITKEWLEKADLLTSLLAGDGHLSTRYLAVAPEILRKLPVAHHAEAHAPLGKLKLEALALQILSGSIEALQSDLPRVDGRTIKRVERAQERLTMTSLADVSLVALARDLGTSTRQLQRDFLAVHGMGPIAYVRLQRLKAARLAIQSGEATLNEAAIQAGYASISSFSRAYLNSFGVRPGHFRKR
ncbi:MAG: helix-turn-helix domain-containing protein [Pseudomonadota bacterium]